jgi:nicotinamide mononucleotide transporter
MSFFEKLTSAQVIEALGTVLSLIYLYLEVKEKKALWFVGILSSAIYAWVFFDAHFYADFALSVYYVIISIYGWIHWIKGASDETHHELEITRINIALSLKLFIITILLYLPILVILLYLPKYIGLLQSSFPYIDAFIAAASIVGTWMLSQKKLEHWYVWIVINITCIFLFYAKGLNTTAFLYLVYAIGSFTGLRTWLKTYQASKSHV